MSPPVLRKAIWALTTTIVQQNMFSYNSCSMRNELCPECDGGNEIDAHLCTVKPTLKGQKVQLSQVEMQQLQPIQRIIAVRQ
jgi:hypothetical protein